MSPPSVKVAAAPSKSTKVAVGGPTEHIILVTGPSNTFNGYFGSTADDKEVAVKAPTTLDEVEFFISGRHHGVMRPDGVTHKTHDLYWANFIDPVPRLFSLGYATASPGDIITVMIYIPTFEQREKVDWAASPWNEVWKESPYVRCKAPFDSSIVVSSMKKEGGAGKGSGKPSTAAVHPSMLVKVSEARIDHEILMRTTANPLDRSDGDFGVKKAPPLYYPSFEGEYTFQLTYIASSIRGILKSLGVQRVLIKVLLVRDPQEVLDYITDGTWKNTMPWIHPFKRPGPDEMDFEEFEQKFPLEKAAAGGFTYDGSAPPTDEIRKLWDQLPAVDRTKFKIRRFDYFGHSGSQALIFDYGATNKKGEIPTATIGIIEEELVATFSKKKLLTKKAEAHLWGCFLGHTIASKLAEYFHTVKACPERTNYSRILDGPDRMPVPSDGKDFTVYERK